MSGAEGEGAAGEAEPAPPNVRTSVMCVLVLLAALAGCVQRSPASARPNRDVAVSSPACARGSDHQLPAELDALGLAGEYAVVLHVEGEKGAKTYEGRIWLWPTSGSDSSRATGKPLIIHTRSASADTIRIMREEGAGSDAGGAAGVMHCFTESLEVAEAAMEMGFYISFSGIVTFKSAKELQAVARAVPLERMLIETDSPYLAPVPYRGKTNEPGYVRHVAEFLASLKGVPVEQVAHQTTENFFNLFKCLQ